MPIKFPFHSQFELGFSILRYQHRSMSSTPDNPDGADNSDSAVDSKTQSAARLRALLDGVELTPEQTSDDVAPPSNRDRELLEDVPPHHG
jgi:hypothetical protein